MSSSLHPRTASTGFFTLGIYRADCATQSPTKLLRTIAFYMVGWVCGIMGIYIYIFNTQAQVTINRSVCSPLNIIMEGIFERLAPKQKYFNRIVERKILVQYQLSSQPDKNI